MAGARLKGADPWCDASCNAGADVPLARACRLAHACWSTADFAAGVSSARSWQAQRSFARRRFRGKRSFCKVKRRHCGRRSAFKRQMCSKKGSYVAGWVVRLDG